MYKCIMDHKQKVHAYVIVHKMYYHTNISYKSTSKNLFKLIKGD